jgi:hypothetical protein
MQRNSKTNKDVSRITLPAISYIQKMIKTWISYLLILWSRNSPQSEQGKCWDILHFVSTNMHFFIHLTPTMTVDHFIATEQLLAENFDSSTDLEEVT